MGFNRINRQKICMIVNSAIQQSVTDAQWYIAQRGLNPNLILSFDFTDWNGVIGSGTGAAPSGDMPFFLRSASYPQCPVCTTPGYTNLTLVQAVAQFVADHQCEGLLCSTFTPTMLPAAINFAQFCSNAYWWIQSGKTSTNNPATADPIVYRKQVKTVSNPNLANIQVSQFYRYFVDGQNSGWQPDGFYSRVRDDWKTDNFPQIPHGRIGASWFSDTPLYGVYDRTFAAAEVMDPLNPSRTIMYRCVQDAMAAEQVDHRNDIHLFSTDQSYVGTAADNTRVYNYALGQGINAKRVNLAAPTDYYTTQFTVTFDIPTWFGFAINSTRYNPNPALGGSTFYSECIGKLSLAQGAFYLSMSSGCGIFGVHAILGGACASIGTFNEPSIYNGGPLPNEMFQFMHSNQCSMMEANFLCYCTNLQAVAGKANIVTNADNILGSAYCSGWNTVFGDPLYSPYISTPLRQVTYPGIGAGVQFPSGYVQSL